MMSRRLKKIIAVAALLVLAAGFNAGDSIGGQLMAAEAAYLPPDGFIPDSATAVRIAEAILIPIYGRKSIEAQRPFVAKRHDESWTVIGSPKANQLGGVVTIRLDRRTAQVLSVQHGR